MATEVTEGFWWFCRVPGLGFLAAGSRGGLFCLFCFFTAPSRVVTFFRRVGYKKQCKTPDLKANPWPVNSLGRNCFFDADQRNPRF